MAVGSSACRPRVVASRARIRKKRRFIILMIGTVGINSVPPSGLRGRVRWGGERSGGRMGGGRGRMCFNHKCTRMALLPLRIEDQKPGGRAGIAKEAG